MAWRTALDLILDYRRQHPSCSKQELATAVAENLRLTKHRSVYACERYALRFSEASGPSFSNAVLSLSALRAFDHVPFIVVVVRPDSTEFLLANSSFLKKISHSSHQLRIDNLRGSFLGHDIVRSYEGVPNRPDEFERLIALHQEFLWEENVARLVAATGQIIGTGQRFAPTPAQRDAILGAPRLALWLAERAEYAKLKSELSEIVSERASRILEHAAIDNVNVRGNLIEREITGGLNAHGLADMIRHVADRVELQIEIKTKLLDRASSPKAYNIDKALEVLARGTTLIAYCFVGIQPSVATVMSSTVSIFDRTVLSATRTQFHWAGRNSRGVTQLTGDFARVFLPGYCESVDVDAATRFLEGLLEL